MSLEVEQLKNTYLKEKLSQYIASAYDRQQGFVIYRKPDEQELHFISGKKIIELKEDFLQDKKPGFVFSTFRKDSGLKRLFIPADVHHKLNRDQQTEEVTTKTRASFYFLPVENESTTKEDYHKTVEESIKQIQAEEFKKVVLSKVKVEPRSGEDLLDSFLDLCSSYPSAFVNLVSIPQSGTWLGATPEVLISKTKDSFTTVSLAGTQKADVSIKDAVWRQKEIEEQAFVNRYIVDCFKAIRLRFYKEIGPKTVQAGNLLHLKTIFKVNLNEQETDFPDLENQMLNLLHPTSAVCGVPMKPALDFILKTEKHERKFYSGYLGPVNMNDETNLYVNLRCAEIGEKLIAFYAGAGITEDSDPEKEWQETEMKCDTLLKFL